MKRPEPERPENITITEYRHLLEYCDHLESERDEWKRQAERHSALAIHVQQELQALKEVIEKIPHPTVYTDLNDLGTMHLIQELKSLIE